MSITVSALKHFASYSDDRIISSFNLHGLSMFRKEIVNNFKQVYFIYVMAPQFRNEKDNSTFSIFRRQWLCSALTLVCSKIGVTVFDHVMLFVYEATASEMFYFSVQVQFQSMQHLPFRS